MFEQTHLLSLFGISRMLLRFHKLKSMSFQKSDSTEQIERKQKGFWVLAPNINGGSYMLLPQ